jgi:hypothetical protein
VLEELKFKINGLIRQNGKNRRIKIIIIKHFYLEIRMRKKKVFWNSFFFPQESHAKKKNVSSSKIRIFKLLSKQTKLKT